MKYIDAEKLIAEIDKRLSIFEHGIAYSCWESCKKIVESLQREQPEVDIWKEIHKYFNPNGMELQFDRNKGNTILKPGQLFNFAHHFYDLGCRHTAEEADRIEFERQEREEREPTIKGWVARDRGAVNAMDIECGGDLNLWPKVPYRNNVGLFWMQNFPQDYAIMGLPRTLFPELHWEDDPIEVELTIHKV